MCQFGEFEELLMGNEAGVSDLKQRNIRHLSRRFLVDVFFYLTVRVSLALLGRELWGIFERLAFATVAAFRRDLSRYKVLTCRLDSS